MGINFGNGVFHMVTLLQCVVMALRGNSMTQHAFVGLVMMHGGHKVTVVKKNVKIMTQDDVDNFGLGFSSEIHQIGIKIDLETKTKDSF